MPKGLSLHLGLNAVDPKHYQGWSGPLTACEADANDMQNIAVGRSFTPRMLLTGKATRPSVIKEIRDAAAKLSAGDIFLLTYSGHGGQVPDLNGDEPDGLDETWCLYDAQLIDDEVFDLLAGFKPGVRILVFSDSCHSGTILKFAYAYGNNRMQAPENTTPLVYRAMPLEFVRRVYEANKDFYDPILRDQRLASAQERVQASALLISGCQDNQLSADGAFNGLFTGTMLGVWARGTFKKNYKEFHAAIVNRMPPDQTPNYFTVGAPNPTFENQIPFTI